MTCCRSSHQKKEQNFFPTKDMKDKKWRPVRTVWIHCRPNVAILEKGVLPDEPVRGLYAARDLVIQPIGSAFAAVALTNLLLDGHVACCASDPAYSQRKAHPAKNSPAKKNPLYPNKKNRKK